MAKKGFTLIELLIVIALIAILAAIAGLAGRSWMGKARVEQGIQQMHADLSNARSRAMNRNRVHFVEFPNMNTYRIWEDWFNQPDGNGALDIVIPPTIPGAAAGGDWLLMQVNTRDNLVGPLPLTPRFDNRGVITNLGTIRIQNDFGAAMDCIVISETRIRLGRWDGAICQP